MNIPLVDLKAQYDSIKKEIDEAIQFVIKDCTFVKGKYVQDFEESFAKYCGTKYCIGVGSGTDALRLSLLAADIKEYDEVITVPNTFIATVEAITTIGARVKFVDINPITYNIDVRKIESAITNKTKAIIPVHLYGQPADMNPILEIAKNYKLLVIEDCAQAHGAIYKNKRVGTLGHIGCFSFFPGKNLGAYGDGGGVVTNNKEFAEKIRLLKDHGAFKKYQHLIPGYNSRLDGIQAAVLNVKLKYLKQWNEKRRKIASLYQEKLNNIFSVIIPKVADNVLPVYHLYVIQVERRDELKHFLNDKGINTGIHYPIPVHLTKAYSDLGFREGDYPVTEDISKKILSVPIFPELKDEHIEFIISSIKEFFS